MVAEVNFNKNNTILTGDGLLDAAGEQIQYEFVIENEGDQEIDGFLLSDSLLGFNDVDVIAAILADQLIVSGDTDNDQVLDIGETWTLTEGPVAGVDLTYTVTQADLDSNGTAEDTGGNIDIVGQIDNFAQLLGTQGGNTVTVSEESTAAPLTLDPQIDIEKSTNGEDADTAPGVIIPVGDTASFTYEVANDGNVALDILSVTDDNGTPGDLTDDFALDPVDADGDGSNVGDDPDDTDATVQGNGLLDTDETWLYTAPDKTVIAGQYTNVATVVAEDPAGTEVDDTDPSNHFGSDPVVRIEKATNGEDADTAPGVIIPVGGTASFTYEVFNDGNVPLEILSVTDDNGTLADLTDDFALDPVDADGDGSNVGDDPDDTDATVQGNGLLDTDETWLYTAPDKTVTAGQFTNVATVVAEDSAGTEVDDTDPSNHFGVEPDIEIVKTGAFNDESGDGFAQPGETITYQYQVTTGTGNADIFLVDVTDDNGTPGDTTDDFAPDPVDEDGDGSIAGDDPDDTNPLETGNDILEVGETWLYTANVAIDQADIDAGGITNIACVEGEDEFATPVDDCDDEFVPLEPPPEPGTAMTPGFWKNHLAIFEQETGFDPETTDYEDIFGVDVVGKDGNGKGGGNFLSDDPTLLEAVSAKGGGEGAFLRATTAAWANASSDDLNYCFEDEASLVSFLSILETIDDDGDGCLSDSEIINVVQDVYTDGPSAELGTDNFDLGDMGSVASALDAMNNLPHIDAGDFMV